MRKLKIILLIVLIVLPLLIIGHYNSIPAMGQLVGWGERTLIYARKHDSVTLDPAFAQDEESFKVICNIFEGLVRLKQGSTEVEPCLAESWKVSHDGMEWTFYLRKNVIFHDGTPFNSEAVRFSIERQMPPLNPSHLAYASFTFGMVEQILTPDPYIVKFRLKYPYSPFLHNLAMPASAPIVSPPAAASLGAGFGKRPVGTGPYIFSKWEKGRKIVLKANNDYWGKVPEHQLLIFSTIKNSRLRALMLKAGLADISDELSPADIVFLKNNNIPVFEIPGLDLNYLGFFTDKKPFDDPSVRNAFSMLIDREHIVKKLFPGAYHEATGPLPPGILGYDPSIRPNPYDPARARELLTKKNFETEKKLTIITYSNIRPYNPVGGEKMAKAIQAELTRAGVDSEIKVYTWDKYKEALLNKEGNAFLYGWISDNADPDNFLYTLLSSTQIENGLNTAQYRNSEVDRLLAAAQREQDPSLREQIYRKAVKIIIEDAPWVFLNHSLKHSATSPKVKGFVLQPGGFSALNYIRKE